MTTKEWLQRGIEIEEEIADLQAVNPVVFLDEINVAVYEQNIKNRIGELYKIKNEILQTVNQVESATLRRLLIKRYIQNLTWEKIAEQLFIQTRCTYSSSQGTVCNQKSFRKRLSRILFRLFLYAEFYKNP